MTLSLPELRKISDHLFSHLDATGHASVEVDADEFWETPRQRYDPYAEPRDLEMGRLSENLTNLREMLGEPDETVGYGFVWLAALLRAVGESVAR